MANCRKEKAERRHGRVRSCGVHSLLVLLARKGLASKEIVLYV